MTELLPSSARCAVHRDNPAKFACTRCGDFACEVCEFRVRPEAAPMCSHCWEGRQDKVQVLAKTHGGMTAPNIAITLGLLSLIPYMWPAQLVGVFISIKALLKALKDPAQIGFKRSVAGLAFSLLGALLTVVLLVLVP